MDWWMDGCVDDLGGSLVNWIDARMKRETNPINMTSTVKICFICI